MSQITIQVPHSPYPVVATVNRPITATRSDQPTDPVIMSHGLGMNRDEYLGFYSRLSSVLARSDRPSLRFDHRGHGASAAPASELTLRGMTLDLLAATKWTTSECATQRAVLVGTSFGAPAVIALAALVPHLVSGIVLVAPVSDFRALYVHSPYPSRSKYRNLLRDGLVDQRALHVEGRVWFHPQIIFEFATVDLSVLASTIECPVTVFHGVEDPVVPLELSQRLVEVITLGKLHPLSGTDHGFTEIGDSIGQSEVSQANFDQIVRSVCAQGHGR